MRESYGPKRFYFERLILCISKNLLFQGTQRIFFYKSKFFIKLKKQKKNLRCIEAWRPDYFSMCDQKTKKKKRRNKSRTYSVNPYLTNFFLRNDDFHLLVYYWPHKICTWLIKKQSNNGATELRNEKGEPKWTHQKIIWFPSGIEKLIWV